MYKTVINQLCKPNAILIKQKRSYEIVSASEKQKYCSQQEHSKIGAEMIVFANECHIFNPKTMLNLLTVHYES